MALSIKVAMVLYKNCVPGLCTIGVARKAFTQSSVLKGITVVGSGSCPALIVRRSFTVSAASQGFTVSGRLCGKKETTLSVTFSFPSVTAKPTAVLVKLLLVLYRLCFKLAA